MIGQVYYDGARFLVRDENDYRYLDDMADVIPKKELPDNIAILKLTKIYKTRYLIFNIYERLTGKSKVVSVMNKNGELLGGIQWMGRSYWYATKGGIRYDSNCLRAVNDCITVLGSIDDLSEIQD